MITERTKLIAERAKAVYAARLQADLESGHPNRFVAIEPDSGDYFLGDTFSQAVANARAAHPTRISFVICVGHATAIQIGGMAT